MLLSLSRAWGSLLGVWVTMGQCGRDVQKQSPGWQLSKLGLDQLQGLRLLIPW